MNTKEKKSFFAELKAELKAMFAPEVPAETPDYKEMYEALLAENNDLKEKLSELQAKEVTAAAELETMKAEKETIETEFSTFKAENTGIKNVPNEVVIKPENMRPVDKYRVAKNA